MCYRVKVYKTTEIKLKLPFNSKGILLSQLESYFSNITEVSNGRKQNRLT